MQLELYGVDEDEQDIRLVFKDLQAVQVVGDFIEVVSSKGVSSVVAYAYFDDNSVYWSTEQKFVNGQINPKFIVAPEYSGLSIVS